MRCSMRLANVFASFPSHWRSCFDVTRSDAGARSTPFAFDGKVSDELNRTAGSGVVVELWCEYHTGGALPHPAPPTLNGSCTAACLVCGMVRRMRSVLPGGKPPLREGKHHGRQHSRSEKNASGDWRSS